MASHLVLSSAHFCLKTCIWKSCSVASTPSVFSQIAHRVNLHTETKHLQTESGQKVQKFGLSFEDYQKLKKSLRMKQRMVGIPSAFISMTISSYAITRLNPDTFDATPENVQLIMGLDPLVFSGISGVIAAGVGYVVVANLYKLYWVTRYKQDARNLQERDKDFLQRLDKYRFGADSKSEDDYYGESIKNMSDYRQWVRTQQRKKQTQSS